MNNPSPRGGGCNPVLLILVFVGVAYGLYLLSQQDPTVSAQIPATAPQMQTTPRPSSGLYGLILGAMDAQSTAAAAFQQANEAGQYANQTQNQLRAAQTSEAQSATLQAGQALDEAQRRDAESTAVAGSTVTAQAWAVIGWTATADANKATEQAYRDAQIWDLQRTADAIELQKKIDAAEYDAAVLRQTQARNEATNFFRAWWWVGVLILAAIAMIIIGAVSIIKWIRMPAGTIPRDARGDAPFVVSNNGDIIDMDRVLNGVLRLLKTGPVAPLLADPAAQERTTMRDQSIDMATRGYPEQGQPQRNNRGKPAQLPAVPVQNYRIYIEPNRPEQLPAETEQILDARWKELKS
jgi:hypothetical protein